MSSFSTKFNVLFNFSGRNDLDDILKQLKMFHREVDAATGEVRDLGISFKELDRLVNNGELSYTLHVGDTERESYKAIKNQALYYRPENLAETELSLKSVSTVFRETPIYDLSTIKTLVKRQIELQIDTLLYSVVYEAMHDAVIEDYKAAYRNIDLSFLSSLPSKTDEFKSSDYDNIDKINYSSYASISKALVYYEHKKDDVNLNNATKKEIEGYISTLNIARESLSRVLNSQGRPAELLSIDDIKKERDYLQDQLKIVENEKARVGIQLEIDNLDKIKKTWDDALAELKKPGKIATLDTMEKLDEAITYYQTKQKKATGEEVDNIGKTIAALERKRAAMLRGTDLQEQLREANATNALSGREYRVKVSGMGFDALTEKIRDLQMMLSDTENPVTGAQRKDIEELIKIYEKWRKECVKSMDTVKKGWSSLKGVGDSVEGITDALKGNGDAWQKVTAVIDGVLQLYDSFSGIIEIIQMLTMATQGHTAAKAVEAATVTEGAAMEVGATTSVAEANIVEANSAVAAAAAETMKAHASIPWVGIAIGAGMVATMLGLLFALPKFADGGLAYGPTLGLFGEYAGASNNPEVVAPLSKLKGMLADVGGLGGGRVVFKIEGRTLVGILKKETTHQARTK